MGSTTGGADETGILTAETARGLARALTDFGFRLQRALPAEGNLVLSPLSAWLTLLALVPGSRGSTRDELVHALAGGSTPSPDDLAAVGAELVRSLRRRTGATWERDPETGDWREKTVDLFVLEIATALWAAEGYPFHEAYLRTLVDVMEAEAGSLDFADAPATADRVNAWAAERTKGRVSSVLSPEAIDPRTRLLLANATYFRARWLNPFLKEKTQPAPFHSPRGTVEAEMMQGMASRGHARLEDPGSEVVALSYDAMAALLIVPDRGALDQVEDAISSDFVQRLRGDLAEKDVTLHLPRFDFGSSLDLERVLPEVGVRQALSERADFSAMTPHPEGLTLSGVIQEARILVDEEGTEAAAVTLADVLALGEAEEEPERVTVVADRPFLFLVWDPQTGAVLFTVRVSDPTRSD